MIKKSNKSSKSSKSKSKFSFEDLPWKWIIIGIVGVLILFGILQVVRAFIEITKPLAQFFEGAAGLGIELVTPCVQQQDCEKLGSDCNNCKGTAGCTCGDGTKCLKYASRDVGSGGFFQSTFPFINLNCFLGVGFLALIIGGPLLAFIKLIISGTVKGCTKLVDYVTSTGKSKQDVVTEWTKKTKTNLEKTKEELKKQGVDVTPELSDIIERITIEDVTTKDIYENANNSRGSLESRKIMVKDATIAQTAKQKQYEAEITKYQAEKGEGKDLKDIIDNNREKIPPEPKFL